MACTGIIVPLPLHSVQSLTFHLISFATVRFKKNTSFFLVANSSSSSSSSNNNNNNNNVSGWQDDNMGCIHNKQRTCSDYAYNMGDGLCICAIRKFGSLWVSSIFVISLYFEIRKQRNNAEQLQHFVSCININKLLLDCYL